MKYKVTKHFVTKLVAIVEADSESEADSLFDDLMSFECTDSYMGLSDKHANKIEEIEEND